MSWWVIGCDDPLEPSLQKGFEAQWSFNVVDLGRCLVTFKDESVGEVNSWHWNFGDGKMLTEMMSDGQKLATLWTPSGLIRDHETLPCPPARLFPASFR